MSADPLIRLAKTADAAWARYASTCRTGGTPQQRHWAFDQALEAELRLARHQRAAETDELPAVNAA